MSIQAWEVRFPQRGAIQAESLFKPFPIKDFIHQTVSGKNATWDCMRGTGNGQHRVDGSTSTFLFRQKTLQLYPLGWVCSERSENRPLGSKKSSPIDYPGTNKVTTSRFERWPRVELFPRLHEWTVAATEFPSR